MSYDALTSSVSVARTLPRCFSNWKSRERSLRWLSTRHCRYSIQRHRLHSLMLAAADTDTQAAQSVVPLALLRGRLRENWFPEVCLPACRLPSFLASQRQHVPDTIQLAVACQPLRTHALPPRSLCICACPVRVRHTDTKIQRYTHLWDTQPPQIRYLDTKIEIHKCLNGENAASFLSAKCFVDNTKNLK